MVKKNNKETFKIINKDHKDKLVLYQNSHNTFTQRESIIFHYLYQYKMFH